jgi:ATP-binding cassette, subfamily C, bacterial exporter for protease/lipase
LRNDIRPDQEPGQEGQAQRGPIAKLLLDSRRVFFLAFLLTFVWEVLSLAPIIYMMNLFDRVMTSRSEVTLVSLTVLFVVAVAFSSSVDWLRKQLLMRMALRLDWDLAMDVFDASFKNFVGHKRMNVQQIMGDLVVLRKFFQGNGFFTLIHVPFALVFVAVLYLFSPSLAAFSLSALVLMAIFAVLKARAVTPLIREATKAAAETNRSVAESLRHSETALALGMQSTNRSKWYNSPQADQVLSVAWPAW